MKNLWPNVKLANVDGNKKIKNAYKSNKAEGPRRSLLSCKKNTEWIKYEHWLNNEIHFCYRFERVFAC